MWKFGKFVLHFDNFPGRFEWNNERMQSESSRRRRNDEFVVRPRLIFLIIFVTSCYVLNKIVILSENSILEWFGSTPGQEILPGNRNSECNHHKTIQNWKKWENREKHAKTSGFIDFSMLKIHFRFADAANHLNARPRVLGEIRMTRRAYWSQL